MASGNTLAVFMPQAHQPPASAFGVIDTNNSHLVLSFANGSDLASLFSGTLTRNYGGGGLTVTLVWAATVNAGNVKWNAYVERLQDGVSDITSNSFAAAQSVTDTVPGTAGVVKYSTITFTSGAQMDSLAAGEAFRLKVERNGASGSDTAAGAAQLLRVEIRES